MTDKAMTKPTGETPRCELCGEPMPPGEEMFKYHGYSGDCPKPPLPKPAVKVPHVEHDDLCVWWDNAGKEPPDYACTCGRWAPFLERQLAERDARIAALEKALERYEPKEGSREWMEQQLPD